MQEAALRTVTSGESHSQLKAKWGEAAQVTHSSPPPSPVRSLHRPHTHSQGPTPRRSAVTSQEPDPVGLLVSPWSGVGWT